MAKPRIEFIGLPGAGKSTLCKALLAALNGQSSALSYAEALSCCLRRRDKGIPGRLVRTLPESFWLPLLGAQSSWSELHRFSSDHCSLLHLVFELLDKHQIDKDWRDCILYVFFSLATEHELFEKWLPAKSFMIIEEGFVQAALSAFGYLPLPQESQIEGIERYLKRCPLPEAVIWVDTPPLVCLERVLSRTELPLIVAGGEKEDKLTRFTYLDRCLKDAVEMLASLGIPVWRAETMGDGPGALVLDLVRHIDGMRSMAN